MAFALTRTDPKQQFHLGYFQGFACARSAWRLNMLICQERMFGFLSAGISDFGPFEEELTIAHVTISTRFVKFVFMDELLLCKDICSKTQMPRPPDGWSPLLALLMCFVPPPPQPPHQKEKEKENEKEEEEEKERDSERACDRERTRERASLTRASPKRPPRWFRAFPT